MRKLRPIVIDLFAGAGGLSLGFEQAGFDVVAAVEVDPVHACVHKFNFPNCTVIPSSVANITGSDIRRTAGIVSNTVIDVVAGGAPCQGFSIIGQRALEDPRNYLVKEFIRLVRELRPLYFVFENVKGIAQKKYSQFLNQLVDQLSSSGYTIEPWHVLNAKDFGIPQNRERLFLLGARDGCSLPDYPKTKNAGTTCADALEDLPNAEAFEQLLSSSTVRTQYLKKAEGYSALMRCSAEESWYYGYKRIWDQRVLTNSRRTRHTQTSQSRFKQTEPGTTEPISRFFRLSPDGLSNTLRAGTDSSRGSFTSPRPIHYKYPRCITVREMARLHGFPDWFRLHNTTWHGARQVGNSVPPPLAFALAREIMNASSGSPTRPSQAIALGEELLLGMNISTASSYWGIANPIKKRCQKAQ